jgi:hypothetical protein
MYIILVSYRARELQQFRRNEIIKMIDNFKSYFEMNKIQYKIVISEQYNDNKFNRGFLLNAAFLEAEKNFNFSKKYIHMNVDYYFNLSMNFPEEFLNFKEGFMEIYCCAPQYNILSSSCLFDSESYKSINGFPNDLEGWGGDDWAIRNRIIENDIKLLKIDGLFNNGLVFEEKYNFENDVSNNDCNINLAMRNDTKSNGLNSIKYKLEGYGEFHDGDIIFHYLINYD